MGDQKLIARLAIALTPADVLAKGKEMAEKNQALLKLEAEKKEEMGKYSDKINALHAEVNDLSSQIASGQTEKDIEIVEEPDDGRKMMLRTEKESGKPLPPRKMTLEEIADSEFRLNGGPTNGVHDTEPAPPSEKPKGRRAKKTTAEAVEEASE